jgi:hypothetical protein
VINTAAGGHLVFGDNADIQNRCIFASVLSPLKFGANVMIGSY